MEVNTSVDRQIGLGVIGMGGFGLFAVQRPDNHPMRPANYQPLDGFWIKRGYRRDPSLQSTFWWPDRGEEVSTAKPMLYWTRRWV